MIDMGDDGKIAYLLHLQKRARLKCPLRLPKR